MISTCSQLPLLYGKVPVGGGCKTVGNTAPKAAKYNPVIDAACAAQGGAPDGEAKPTGAVTFCCGS